MMSVPFVQPVSDIEAMPPWTPLGCKMTVNLPMSRETTPLMVASVIESDY